MKKAVPTPDEAKRIEKLRGYNILDTLGNKLDDLAEVASIICETPIALVSLVDSDRQWFKARIGLEAEQTARDVSFCGHAIQDDKLFHIADSHLDERFIGNPLVSDAKVRFYAGAPLITPTGEKVGTLCVIDHEPRNLTDSQKKRALVLLSRQEWLTKWKLENLRSKRKGLIDSKVTFLPV